MSRENRFPGLVVAVAVPSLALIVTRHAALGAALVGIALAAWVAHIWMAERAEHAYAARLLDYARTTTNLGGDPTTVISALRQRVPAEDDDAELYEPETERGWVHLHASEW
jgi:hypothetical protein